MAVTVAACTPGAVDTVEAAGDGAGSTTTYAGIQLTLVEARVSEEPPEPDAAEDGSWIVVELDLENTLDETQITLPAGLFVLRSDDGGAVRSEGWLKDELEGRLAIEARERTDGTLIYAVEDPNTDLSQFRLYVEERGKEPAILALDGGRIPDTVPASIEIDGTRETVTASQPAHHDVDVEPLSVGAALDWGSQRVDLDHYFVIVELQAHGLTSSLGGTNVFHTMFRMEVDGVLRGKTEFTGPGLLDEGVSRDYVAVFQVPDTTNELALVVGDPDGVQARYDVTFESPASE